MLAQQREDLGHVLHVLAGRAGVYDHVVQVDLTAPAQHRRQDRVHKTLKRRRSAGAPHGHDPELVRAEPGAEGRFVPVLRGHLDLVEARCQVYFAEVPRPLEAVEEVINAGQRPPRLDCDGVEHAVVDDKAFAAVLFLD